MHYITDKTIKRKYMHRGVKNLTNVTFNDNSNNEA